MNMSQMNHNLRFVLIALLCLVFSSAKAQEPNWTDKFPVGYVYQINNKEAVKLLKGKIKDEKYESILHTIIDTFVVDSGWNNVPEQGHFVMATIEKDELHCRYFSKVPYQVIMFSEYGALSLQVIDQNGNVRDDAKVKLNKSRINIDTASHTFSIVDESFYGEKKIATVELDGFVSAFQVDKYKRPTSSSWNSGSSSRGPDFYSYMITDKNKYRPGDTVCYKSFALNGSKFPIRKPLDLYLVGGRKRIKLGSVEPYNPGGFAGSFVLHDSLNLSLDMDYSLRLLKGHRTVSTCSFKHEDYELFGNELRIDLETYQQYYPNSNKLTISATDANGLMLKDAVAEITVSTKYVRETYKPIVVVPNTVIHEKIKLDPANPTEFEIPAELFGAANVEYQISVEVLNSENERLTYQQMATYYYSNYEMKSHFEADTICFDILANGVPLHDVAVDMFIDAETEPQKVTFPYYQLANPTLSRVRFENELVSKSFNYANMYHNVSIEGGIQQDSFIINLDNPQLMDVTWNIYRGSEKIHSAFGKELSFEHKIEDRSYTYYVEMFYTFGGEEHSIKREFVFRDYQLDVEIDMPDRVYPGQTVDATVKVENANGIPLKGVDLTAMAVNSKLDYYLPSLPYYGEESSSRDKRDWFETNDIQNYTILKLNYSKWNKIARLDTSMYYKFVYPNRVFEYSYAVDSITQFAPFVMKDGKALKIFAIEVNSEPVYFSWTDKPERYSFRVPHNKFNSVAIRLRDRVIYIPNQKFDKGSKTILSINYDNLPRDFRVIMLSDELTQSEKNRYNKYTCFVNRGLDSYSFLEGEDGIIPLFSANDYKRRPINVGPVRPGYYNYVASSGTNIHYEHEGDYSYEFKDNVVYKRDAKGLLPNKLYSNPYYPLAFANDIIMDKAEFIESQNIQYDNLWKTDKIDVSEGGKEIKIRLPQNTHDLGISGLFFERYKDTSRVYSQYANYGRKVAYFPIVREGMNRVVVLFDDASYLLVDSVPVLNNNITILQLEPDNYYNANDTSKIWLTEFHLSNIDGYEEVKGYTNNSTSKSTPSKEYLIKSVDRSNHNVSGYIRDEDGEPVIGANVVIEGTIRGTCTDFDGYFSLQIDTEEALLIFSSIGMVTEKVWVERGAEVDIILLFDLVGLDEVVVIGYGTMKKCDVTGSVSSISSDDLMSVPEKEESVDEDSAEELKHQAADKLYADLLNIKTIRSNFSDVGFWQPSLVTDRRGEAKFTVTFPDNITKWNAIVYAMNRSAYTGTVRKDIKSYKPIMGELHVPRFLTVGDSAACIGKVLNYSQDSLINGKVEYSGMGNEFTNDVTISDYYSSQLWVTPQNTDTLTGKFTFTRTDGYFDGEQRDIPVVKQGIVRVDGGLGVIKNEESVTFKSEVNKERTIEILKTQLDIYERDIHDLINYKYACNEQLASKLIGLINQKYLSAYKGEEFKYDKDIKKIITRLLNNQNQDFLWSWWNSSSNSSYWISSHILRALKYADNAGYPVALNTYNLGMKANYRYEQKESIGLQEADVLNALAQWNVDVDYKKYINELDSLIIAREQYYDSINSMKNTWYRYKPSFLNEKLLLQEIKQLTGQPIQRDSILKYKREGVMGDIYFADNNESRNWYYNDWSNNILAYRIVARDSVMSDMKEQMQLYFLNIRKSNNWNTYYSSTCLMSILPDIMESSKNHVAYEQVELSGALDTVINEFPYKVVLKEGEALEIKKHSGLPMFYMSYTHERVTKAKTGVEGFTINSSFENNAKQLEGGKPVDLIVDIDVSKSMRAEYVMIEVPIPAGCSYSEKHQYWNNYEAHREYFKEKTVIFSEKLPVGSYRYKIRLLPRFSGNYILNPAQVSLMYIPVVNANTDMERVVIE